MDDEDDIHDRLERLEATVADQQQTIEQLTETPAVGRRSVVASLLGAGAVGGLAGYGSQSARAQASGPAGQVGTGEEPVDVEAWNLTVQNEADGVGGVENPLTETLEADGNDVTGVGAVEADSINNAEGFSNGITERTYESYSARGGNDEGLSFGVQRTLDIGTSAEEIYTLPNSSARASALVQISGVEGSDNRFYDTVQLSRTEGVQVIQSATDGTSSRTYSASQSGATLAMGQDTGTDVVAVGLEAVIYP